MAGIGLKLRELANSDTLWSFVRAHLYAVILSSAAWVISMTTLIGIYFYVANVFGEPEISVQFLVCVTYLISSSLTLSAVFQNTINRFVSDKVFTKQISRVMPNFMSTILYILLLSGSTGYLAAIILLPNEPWITIFLMTGSFVILNIIWVFTNILAGLKYYFFILFSFILSYALIFLMVTFLYPYQLTGLLLSFYTGHAVMLALFFIFLINYYPSRNLFRWEIRKFMRKHPTLIYSGLFFYLGIWIDKYCFWIYSGTSKQTIGLLNASPIYDMPVFLSFILIIPALSMFFYEMETNFSRYYHRYYESILEGGTLVEISEKHAALQRVTRTTLLNTMEVQAVVGIFALLLAPYVLKLFNLDPIYVFLFRVDIIGASLLVLLIGQINLLYYLDYSKKVFVLTLFFFLSNLSLTMVSLYLGPPYYGYGFTVAIFVSNIIAFSQLINVFKSLTRNAFMQW